MSYDDPLESTAKGITEGFLNWGSEFIKNLATKFRDKKLGFIQDEKTIKIVKEQYHSGELAIYKEYVKDEDMLFLLKMGLTLRKLEKDKEEDRKKNLKEKIFYKYHVKGLHIAKFVENGILNRYLGILIEGITSVEKFKNDLMEILNNIEKYVLFVKTEDNERTVIKQAFTITTSHRSMIFIISGISFAAGTIRNCETRLKELLEDYELEKISNEYQESLFFKRKPN